MADMSAKQPSFEHPAASADLISSGVAPLTIEELETGLCRIDQAQAGDFTFWDENIIAFRRTVLVAIRETSEVLSSDDVTMTLRVRLQGQARALQQYLTLADRYLRSRKLN